MLQKTRHELHDRLQPRVGHKPAGQLRRSIRGNELHVTAALAIPQPLRGRADQPVVGVIEVEAFGCQKLPKVWTLWVCFVPERRTVGNEVDDLGGRMKACLGIILMPYPALYYDIY